MNCYNIENPTNGQQCTDDVLGNLVYNASDGTWEKLDGYTKNGNNYSFDLSTLPGNAKSATTAATSFLQKYGTYVVGAVAFVLVILLLNYFGKK